MKNEFNIVNTTNGDLSFTVRAVMTLPPLVGMSSHHRRRLTKGTAFPITLPANFSLDLCKETGLTPQQLEQDLETGTLIKKGYLKKTEVVADIVKKTQEAVKPAPVAPKVEEPKVEQKPVAPVVEEPKVEEPVAPVVEEPVPANPKPKAKPKAKKKAKK